MTMGYSLLGRTENFAAPQVCIYMREKEREREGGNREIGTSYKEMVSKALKK